MSLTLEPIITEMLRSQRYRSAPTDCNMRRLTSIRYQYTYLFDNYDSYRVRDYIYSMLGSYIASPEQPDISVDVLGVGYKLKTTTPTILGSHPDADIVVSSKDNNVSRFNTVIFVANNCVWVFDAWSHSGTIFKHNGEEFVSKGRDRALLCCDIPHLSESSQILIGKNPFIIRVYRSLNSDIFIGD